MELKIDNISKCYNKEIWAIKDFSLTLNEGIIGLLAPNGAGKTTLLKILATVLKPTRGKVYCNGRDIFKLGKYYRDIIGYLPQSFGVYPNLTAEKFLCYFAALKGVGPRRMGQKIEELLEIVSLRSVKNRKLKTFSGGMKQRLGIAQALINDPKILILDEPTVGLDPDERIKFRNLLIELSENTIILFSTHIVSDVEAVATDIVFMKDGRLLSYATPQQVLERFDGQIYEVMTDIQGARALKRNYTVIHSVNKKEGIQVRVIGDKPCECAVKVQPNLEDAYLYWYKSLG